MNAGSDRGGVFIPDFIKEPGPRMAEQMDPLFRTALRPRPFGMSPRPLRLPMRVVDEWRPTDFSTVIEVYCRDHGMRWLDGKIACGYVMPLDLPIGEAQRIRRTAIRICAWEVVKFAYFRHDRVLRRLNKARRFMNRREGT